MIYLLLFSLTLSSLAWSIMNLEINARKARALNVPVVRIPFDLNNYIWVIIQPLVWAILEYFPVPWSSYPDFVRFSHRNWHFLEKSSPAARFGPVFALVSPGGVHLFILDAEAIENIHYRWRDFSRPTEMYKMLDVYGPNVFTVGLSDWPRHRKAVAAQFNQSIMKHVWATTLGQTQAMVKYWTSRSEAGITGVPEDMRTLSLNVLAAAAFQDSYDFKGSAQQPSDKKSNDSYRHSLYVVHEYAIYLMLIPYRFLTGPLVPRYLADIGRAAQSLEARMTKMVGDEKAAIDQGKVGSNSLLTHLVRAAEDPEADGSKARPAGDQPGNNNSSSGRYWLSADEVLGNIFVINFAGLDTTAITFSFSVMLLAAHPGVQDWLHEEITRVSGGSSRAVGEWDYGLFARLKRCRAVLLETLRLYGPITGLPKMTSETAQVLHVGGRVLSLPPRTETYLDLLSVHTDPRYWDDPLAWRPSRWISATQDLEEEELLVPQKGSFNPWAGGVQGCVGKEFSQVEGVALLACLFHAHTVRPKTEEGETAGQARDRARACVNDVNYQLLLKMNNADRVKLECQPRA